jgi:hypothetical protein
MAEKQFKGGALGKEIKGSQFCISIYWAQWITERKTLSRYY